MKHKYVIFVFLFLISACTPGTVIEETIPEISAPSVELDPLAATQTTLDNSVDVFADATLRITDVEEIVFDWSEDNCEPDHIPDLAARAIRDASGKVQIILSHYVNYRMIGQDFDSLETDCKPIMRSDFNANPAFYNDAQWIAAPYTEDGKTFYALIHNEYRGHTHAGICPSGDYFDCLDTSITLAVSTDAGASYQDISNPPSHLVATLPYQMEPGAGPFGYRTPSNIIKGKDDFYYSFNNVSDYETQKQWVCLMRTDDLAQPGSWRYWNGKDFNGVFTNPYQSNPGEISQQKCAPLDLDNIGASLSDSITFNTFLDRYVLVGISADHLDNREVWGFYYAFSNDLINWSPRKLLMEISLPWTVDSSGSDQSHLYPTLIDHSSESLSFETTGKSAYLYFTRMNQGQASLDRDLIRVPVAFFLEE
jgi:hypothetical protein